MCTCISQCYIRGTIFVLRFVRCTLRGPIESRWTHRCLQVPCESPNYFSGEQWHPPNVRVVAAARVGQGRNGGKITDVKCAAAAAASASSATPVAAGGVRDGAECIATFRVLTSCPLKLSAAAIAAVEDAGAPPSTLSGTTPPNDKWVGASLLSFLSLTGAAVGPNTEAYFSRRTVLSASFFDVNGTSMLSTSRGAMSEFSIDVVGLRLPAVRIIAAEPNFITLKVNVREMFEPYHQSLRSGRNAWDREYNPDAIDMDVYRIEDEGGAMWPMSDTVRIVA